MLGDRVFKINQLAELSGPNYQIHIGPAQPRKLSDFTFVKGFYSWKSVSFSPLADDHHHHPLQHVLRRFCSHVAQKHCKKKGQSVTIRQVRQTDLLEIVCFWTKGCAIAKQVFLFLFTPVFVALDMNVKWTIHLLWTSRVVKNFKRGAF